LYTSILRSRHVNVTKAAADIQRERSASEDAREPTETTSAEDCASEEEDEEGMTDSERIDELQAQLIAYGIALRHLMLEASQEARDAIPRLAEGAAEYGLAESLTDKQIEQIQQCLLSLC